MRGSFAPLPAVPILHEVIVFRPNPGGKGGARGAAGAEDFERAGVWGPRPRWGHRGGAPDATQLPRSSVNLQSKGRTNIQYEGLVRLSHKSMRDVRFWRTLTRGTGRDLRPSPPDLTMHSDAANFGYGGTLGKDTKAGSPGLWVGQGFWTAEERSKSITLRELRAVRLLLHQSFANYVSDPHVGLSLIHI